jgi:phospholipase D1/2
MPDIDQYTAQLAPETKATVSGQYFDLNQPFAFPRYGRRLSRRSKHHR